MNTKYYIVVYYYNDKGSDTKLSNLQAGLLVLVSLQEYLETYAQQNVSNTKIVSIAECGCKIKSALEIIRKANKVNKDEAGEFKYREFTIKRTAMCDQNRPGETKLKIKEVRRNRTVSI